MRTRLIARMALRTLLAVFVFTVVVITLALAVYMPPGRDVWRPLQKQPPGPAPLGVISEIYDGINYSYSSGFIEFDDDGFVAAPEQVNSVLDSIKSLAGKSVVVLAYLHGWNHNASEHDENVACFNELLKATAIMQASYARRYPMRARAVYGLYLGWPGLVYTNPALNKALSFWGRESSADRLGERGDLLHTLLQVSNIRNTVNSETSKFIILAHSLGGRAAYKAIRPIMQRNALNKDGGRLADLTVLVNPALSAADHRSLARIIAENTSTEEWIPRFVVATSSNDEVLRGVYPWSQVFRSFVRGDYMLSNKSRIEAIGLYDQYVTHRLKLEGIDHRTPVTRTTCPTMSFDELEIVRGQGRVKHAKELYDYERIQHYDRAGQRTYATVLEDLSATASGTVMIVKVDGGIIPSHNDIFTSPFVDFLARVINAQDAERRGSDSR